MKRGKQKCKILKEIRRQIAEANGIELATSECRFKGECLGTCPKCEAEVRLLEQQLRARSLAGRAVSLAGISVGTLAMMLPAQTSAQLTSVGDDKGSQRIELYESAIDNNYAADSLIDQKDGVVDFNKERIGESVIINTVHGLKISFENENGEYLEPEDISIERILKQPNGEAYSAPVDKCRLEYFDLTIRWNDIPTFHGEKIEELDSVTLRVIHPQYNDTKTLKLIHPTETIQTTIRFNSPKKQQ